MSLMPRPPLLLLLRGQGEKNLTRHVVQWHSAELRSHRLGRRGIHVRPRVLKVGTPNAAAFVHDFYRNIFLASSNDDLEGNTRLNAAEIRHVHHDIFLFRFTQIAT